VKIVNVDQITTLDHTNCLRIKFANASGYITKEYVLNDCGLNEIYHDFIQEYYLYCTVPFDNTVVDSDEDIEFIDPDFDTHKNLLNKDYSILIEKKNDKLTIVNIELINLEYWMVREYNIPYIDWLEELEEKQRIKDEAESYNNYYNNKSYDNFKFGGLTGEEADTLYWNID
jgi:hypothetical protein